MKWQTFQVFNIPDGQNADPAFLAQAAEVYEHFKKFRAEVIEAGLFIESSLTNVLLDFLSEPAVGRRRLLKGAVLDAEFCTFFQKWKLLRQLLDIYANPLALDSGEMKALRQELHSVIGLRNRFAHGTIFVDGRDFSVWIEYMEGTRQFERLEEEELIAAKDTCDRVHARLWKVHEALAARDYLLPDIEG